MAVFNKLKSLKADYQLEMGKFGEAERENRGLKVSDASPRYLVHLFGLDIHLTWAPSGGLCPFNQQSIQQRSPSLNYQNPALWNATHSHSSDPSARRKS